MKKFFLMILFIMVNSTANAIMHCETSGTYCNNIVIENLIIWEDGRILIKTEEPIPNTAIIMHITCGFNWTMVQTLIVGCFPPF